MVTYHYQSTPYFADQWNEPNDTGDNAENLKTGHGEVGREQGANGGQEAKLR